MSPIKPVGDQGLPAVFISHPHFSDFSLKKTPATASSPSSVSNEDPLLSATIIQKHGGSLQDHGDNREYCKDRSSIDSKARWAELSALVISSMSVPTRAAAYLQQTSSPVSVSSGGTGTPTRVRPFRLRGRLEIQKMMGRFQEERRRELEELRQRAAVSGFWMCKRLALETTLLFQRQSLERQTVQPRTDAPEAPRLCCSRERQEVEELIRVFQKGRRELGELRQRAALNSLKYRQLATLLQQYHSKKKDPER